MDGIAPQGSPARPGAAGKGIIDCRYVRAARRSRPAPPGGRGWFSDGSIVLGVAIIVGALPRAGAPVILFFASIGVAGADRAPLESALNYIAATSGLVVEAEGAVSEFVQTSIDGTASYPERCSALNQSLWNEGGPRCAPTGVESIGDGFVAHIGINGALSDNLFAVWAEQAAILYDRPLNLARRNVWHSFAVWLKIKLIADKCKKTEIRRGFFADILEKNFASP